MNWLNIIGGALSGTVALTAMGEINQANLIIYIYQLSVDKEGNLIRHATIAGVYHTEYMDVMGLMEIYGEVNSSQELDFQGAENTLEAVVEVIQAF